MDRELIKSAEQFHIRRRQRSVWKKLVSVLGCIVVFCTTYALILPAITMERETICGFREHQHSDSCYTQQVVKQMVCSAKDMGVHTHSAECGSSCGYADFMIHEHDASCYDGSGRLVCTLPQVKEHPHSSDCYRIPQIVVGQHTHTDACYSMQQAELLCALTESDGHTHTEGCMSQISNLVCGQEEGETHTHSETCYSTETVLSCEKEEMQAHHHTEDCYRWENKLSCGKEEGPVYGPGEPELICTKKEVKAHTHTAQCFNTDGNWICGQPQILRHVHTQSCFDTSQTKSVLTCDLEEHTHTQACFAEATETTEETTEVTEETTEATEETTEVTEETTEATEETTEATEETTEATEETTEATEEEQTKPTQSFRGLTESNVVVLADADAGAFPAGTTMYASDVSAATARNLAEESADEDTEILDAVGVNITFRNAEGTIIEPENGALVRVNIVLPEEKKLEGDDFSLLHRHNDGTVETVEMAEVNSDGAEFDAESFSIYVVTAMGDKHKSEVHANRTGGYYLNGPYRTNSSYRPYILALGDSVKIYADFDEPTDCNPFFFYANDYTRKGVYVDAKNNGGIITVTQYTTQLGNGKYRTYATITANGLNPVKDSTRPGASQDKNQFNDDHFSLFAISFGQPSGDCDLPGSFTNFDNNAPTNAQKENIENVFFVRFVDKVFVESIGGSLELFVDYYDHADLEIDNSGHFIGKRTIYYLDKTEVETTTYSAAVEQVNSCTLYRTENREEEEIVPVYYCTKKTGKAQLNDVCNHGDDAYKNVDSCDFIDTDCYVGNGAPINDTQYEYTSKFGHIRFSDEAYCASFNFNLFLKPMSRTTKILETGQTTTLDKASVDDLPGLTSTGATTDLNHQSFVDAYNYCPDHSGLDFHISGDISAKIDFKFDPVSVYLGAKKQLTGKKLEAREFSFVLKEGDEVLQTVFNDADGLIRFAPLNFSQAGIYYYTIEEVVPNSKAPGIVYDESKVNVRIEVTGSSENADMAAKIYYNDIEYTKMDALPVFKNKYEGNLIIQKTVVGKAVDPTERFHLTIRNMDGASIEWNKLTVESNKEDRSIALSGNDYQNYLDIYGGEQITIHGLPAGQYSIQEWGAPATVVYTKVTEQGEVGNQSQNPLWSNPREPNDPKGWWYFAGVVELTAEASNATQRITNKFCKLAVTKRVVGDKAPADETSYKVTISCEGSVDWRDVKATSSIDGKTVDLTVNKTDPTNEKDPGVSVSFTLVKDETVTLTNLPVGTYKVVEEEPLTGVLDVDYSTPEGKVTLIAGSTVSETITNRYPNSYVLPETGGGGTERYTLGGFTMAAGAVLWLCYRRKRRREGG